MASREAAKCFFFKYILFLCIEMMWKMLKKKENVKKKVSIRHLKAHPAGGQETKLFLRVA